MIHLSGTPFIWDTMLRPVARGALATIGLLLSVLVLWLEAWWWVPVPLATALVMYELIFWWRGDRPSRLSLGEHLRLDDRIRKQVLHLDPNTVTAATVFFQHLSAHRVSIHVILSDDRRTLFAGHFLVDPTWTPASYDIDVDALDPIVGGLTGLPRAIAPPEAIARQVFDDPAGQAIQWIRERVPSIAWQRAVIRVWKGKQPELAPTGLHQGVPDGRLVFTHDKFELHLDEDVRTGALTLLQGATAWRTALLALPPQGGDEAPIEEEAEIPLLLFEFDNELTLAFPCPHAADAGVVRELDDEVLHTHVVEAAQLVARIISHWPRATWPAA